MLFNIYLICLLVGGIYAVISIVANGILDGLDFDLDFDFDFGSLSLPLKPFTIMTFAAVFGGTGLIALNYLPPLLTLIPAVVLGLIISGALYYLIYVKLRRYETETSSELDAIMKRAEVVERIPPGGYGKISYVIDGNTLSGAAKEKSPGMGIDKGRQVYILDIHENVYLVCEDLEVHLKQN